MVALKNKIRSALIYPVAVLVVAFVVLAVIMIFVIPAFKSVFSSFGADLPAPTLVVMAISDWTVANWYIVFPAMANANFTGTLTATYTQSAIDPVINAGLPAQFTFPVDSYAGTETLLLPKPGATSFYTTNQFAASPGASGVIGWEYGAGRVVNISTTCGPNQVGDPNFAKLLGNLMTWAGDLSPGGMLPCTPDCDKSGSLDFFDFLCFQNQFSQSVPAADCDCNQVFDFFDFLCFQNLFNAGC